MQKTKRIIISLFIIWLSFFSFTKADNSDCWTFAKLYYTQDWWENWFSIVNGARGVSSNKYSNFLTVDEQLAIIDKESLNTALLNLKKYCCENEQWWLTQKSDTCKKDNVFFNPNALDSPYLFDHLFDVIMRRLIWLSSENDIYLKTNMSIDNKWEEWRNRIQEQSLNITWSNPQEIIDKYQETWKQSPTTAWYNIKDKIQATFWNNNDDIFLTYVSWQWSDSQESESKKIAEALKKYEDWTLYDRYDNACALTEYFYSLLNQPVQSLDRHNTINKLSTCNSLVKEQIKQENEFVREVIQRQSNLFIENYVTEYFKYVDKRTNTLKDTLSKSRDRLLDIVRAVPKLIKKCVK